MHAARGNLCVRKSPPERRRNAIHFQLLAKSEDLDQIKKRDEMVILDIHCVCWLLLRVVNACAPRRGDRRECRHTNFRIAGGIMLFVVFQSVQVLVTFPTIVAFVRFVTLHALRTWVDFERFRIDN